MIRPNSNRKCWAAALFPLLVFAAVGACGEQGASRGCSDRDATGTKFTAETPVVNGASYDDVVQTQAPTCSLLAALSAAAHAKFDLASNVKHLGDNRYSVRLYIDNQWKEWQTTFDGWTIHDPDAKDPGEFWVALYQRAYLAACGVDCSDADTANWAAVNNGRRSDPKNDSQEWQTCSRALNMITGKQTEVWTLDQKDPAATVRKIRKVLDQNHCVVVWSDDGCVKKVVDPKSCLVTNHAYTVIAAGPDWIEVRNPWGWDLKHAQLDLVKWSNGKPVYKFKDGFGDGKDDDPNDGILRLGHDRIKYFTYTTVTK